MGKTKIKTIDDDAQVQEPKKKLGRPALPAARRGRQDELVEKLRAELGFEETSEKRAKPESTNNVILGSEATPESKKADSGQARMTEKKAQKQGKAKPRSKKYQEASKDLDRSKTYPINEAVDMVKKLSYSKFDGVLEAHINTANMGIRGLVSLPFASGKKLRILAFGSSIKAEDGVTIGDESTIEEINKGKVDFDLVITTPSWMPKLAKVARILGPRGLMPNPKSGTITSPSADGLKKAVESFQSGKTEYKTEPKAPVIHLGLGKLNQPTEELSANIKTLLQTLGKTRVKKVTLSPTMGPSVKLDLSSI